MTDQRLSVIVVSRHRAGALKRCIAGLLQQDYAATEVIVVADPAGLAAAGSTPGLKSASFDTANISAARNFGLSLAAGEVVAFIDDDAVPEPTWAGRLVAPFANQSVVAATGFVRGRNGISYQWRASKVDAAGKDHPLDVPLEATSLHAGTPDRAIKTQGTNCAFRTSTLRQIGGFDPALRFFLDEADVNLRLAPFGLTAIVPIAQVHHGYLASARRRGDRVPLDLTEIAASTAVFLRRHAPDTLATGHARLSAEQRTRALRHMIAGRIEPRDVNRLMATLAVGWSDGLARSMGECAALPDPKAAFQALPGLSPRPGLMLSGRSKHRSALLAQATLAAAKGQIVTVLCLSPGWKRHGHRFDEAGFWEQTGGLWGRAERTGPRPGPVTLAQRRHIEAQRLAAFRPI